MRDEGDRGRFRGRFRVWMLMGLVAAVAGGAGAIHLRDRADGFRRRAASHSAWAREWGRRRAEFRARLAGFEARGEVDGFVFRSVVYDDPASWERAMEEAIAYHARMARSFDRAAGRPWGSAPAGVPPESIAHHARVESRLAEVVPAGGAGREAP